MRAPEEAAPDWAFRAGTGPAPALDRELVAHDGGWVVGASGDAYVLRFGELLDVVADPEAGTATYLPGAGVEAHTVRHLLIDQVLPHLVSLGRAVLHGSAVAIDGRAIVFVGVSGAGKSSLAAGLVRRGAALVADDHIPLERVGDAYLAHPSYSGLRLWEDSAALASGQATDLPTVAQYTDKRRWSPSTEPAADALPLQAVVVLDHEVGPGDALLELEPFRGAAAFIAVYQQAFRFERSGRPVLTADLDRFADLTRLVPILRLRHRRRLDLLDEVADTLLGALRDAVG